MLVSSREIHRGRVVHLFEDTVVLPNGNTTTLDMIRHPGAAAVVPFLDARTILLVRQFRHAAGGDLLEIPAGKLDPGEPPEACAARETEEEAGYRAGRLVRLGAILTTPGFTDEIIHLYAGYDLVLAGHLHGCQWVACEYRARLFPGALLYPYCFLNDRCGSTRLVVSRGVSDLVPIRWQCPREVVLCHV